MLTLSLFRAFASAALMVPWLLNLATRLLARSLNMPEPLVHSTGAFVFAQVRAVENSFGKSISEEFFGEFKTPMLSISSTDDPIATSANVEDLLRLFRTCPVRNVRLRPEDFDLETIGHIDFFRDRCRGLWGLATDWFDSFS